MQLSETRNSRAPVLADGFKRLFVSITGAIGSWTAGLAIIALLASACATPVGVTRLDEQAAHRELNANVLSTGKPSAYSTQLLERTALSERFKSDPERGAGRIELGAWQARRTRPAIRPVRALVFAHMPRNRGINLTTWHPRLMRMPFCFRQTRPRRQTNMIRACGSRLIFTIAASLWDSRPKMEKKLTLARGN